MTENPQDLRPIVEHLQKEVVELRGRLDRLTETVALLHEELRRLYEEEAASP